MNLRPFNAQLAAEEDARDQAYLMRGMSVLAEGVALCVEDARAAGVPYLSPLELADATGDYGAIGRYWPGEGQRCPRCDSRQWDIGRRTAECGRCGNVMPLAQA